MFCIYCEYMESLIIQILIYVGGIIKMILGLVDWRKVFKKKTSDEIRLICFLLVLILLALIIILFR